MAENVAPKSEPADRLAELRAKKAARDAEIEREAASYELSVLELEEKLSADGSRRGRQFEIVELSDIGEPPVAVRCNVPGIQAVHKAFASSKVDDAAVDAFVVACLASPSPEEYRALVARRPMVGPRAAEAIVHLLGLRKASEKKA